MENLVFSFIQRFNIVKMAALPKMIYRFNAVPIKFSLVIFAEMNKLIIQLIRDYKKCRRDKK